MDWGLCVGCGGCFHACDRQAVELVHIPQTGIRPRFTGDCENCTRCLDICPGHRIELNGSATGEAGPVLEIWQGHASDPEVRYKGSSGGVLSALSLYCLEQGGMGQVLHSAMDPTEPWKNRTVASRSRTEILARSGSRYAPSSPCDGLRTVEESAAPSVFIGKPCDTAAVAMLRRDNPDLDRKLGLVLSFFCAGTPSTDGTLTLAGALGFETQKIREVRYRGEGWPGDFKILAGDGSSASLSYMDSWSRLTKYRPFRCNLCPDGLGATADISCGDAWHAYEGGGQAGTSLVLVRTELGRVVLRKAMEAGYVTLAPSSEGAVLRAQAGLVDRKRNVFGRLLAMRMMAIPAPRFPGFGLFRCWAQLSLARRARSVVGTLRRLVRRRAWKKNGLLEPNAG